MRKLLYRFYWAIEQSLVPGLKSSQYHYRDALMSHLRDGFRWLDLGCGHQVFGDWMAVEEHEAVRRSRPAVGVDMDVAGMRRQQEHT